MAVFSSAGYDKDDFRFCAVGDGVKDVSAN
jgi:hypothetical protein